MRDSSTRKSHDLVAKSPQKIPPHSFVSENIAYFIAKSIEKQKRRESRSENPEIVTVPDSSDQSTFVVVVAAAAAGSSRKERTAVDELRKKKEAGEQ